MFILTEDCEIHCQHGPGQAKNAPSQGFVTVNGRRVLIEPDPVGRPISKCNNSNPPLGIKPCLVTLKEQAGYSHFIRIGAQAVCLDTITGYTDGTPPGTVKYLCTDPGQHFVSGSE